MAAPRVELEHEQAYLDKARRQLTRMREAAEALDASKASDAISGEVLSWVLARRIASLQDDPSTTLFFGRIDTRSDGGLEFDRTVVVEPAAIAAAEPDERTGLRRLYVVLTRAVSEMTVLHSEPLPEVLA